MRHLFAVRAAVVLAATLAAEAPAQRTALRPFTGSGPEVNAFQSAHRGTPRPELLKDWERIAKANKNSAVANQMVRDYQALIAEDRVWKEPDSKVLAKMTAVQKAAYWMHHLRDLDVGSPYFGGCHVLGLTQNRGGGDQKKPNAAVELANLGFDALPLVIDHLDDTRPTRCLAHERDFVQSSHRSYKPDTYYLLRYGDCCQQIFEGITGHTLYQGKTVSHFPTSDGVGKDLKKEAARWWQEFQKKGEKQMLIEGTERGDRSSAEQGRRLAAKFPADALAPIITGARKCKNEWQRNSLVHSAGELSAEQATAFLMEELKTAFPLVRVTAARALVRRGRAEGLDALRREWQQFQWSKYSDFDHWQWLRELVQGLAQANEPAALQVIATDFRKKPLQVRSLVVSLLREPEKDLRGKPLTPAAEAAVEDLLAAALDDREEEWSSRSTGKGVVRDPTLGDLAAEALVERWGRPQLFNIYGPLGTKERQRLEVKNVWLKKRGKEPVPVPAARKIAPAPEAQVQPLLDAVRGAQTAAGRRAPLAALEKLGLPALPAVRKALCELKAADPARAELEALAARLALTMRRPSSLALYRKPFCLAKLFMTSPPNCTGSGLYPSGAHPIGS